MGFEATCGLACWTAKQEICRCACGGKNHGILRDADITAGNVPVRKRRIGTTVYRLAHVVKIPDRDTPREEARQQGWMGSERLCERYGEKWPRTPTARTYRFPKAFYSLVSKAAWEKWPETMHFDRRPYIVWVRDDITDDVSDLMHDEKQEEDDEQCSLIS